MAPGGLPWSDVTVRAPTPGANGRHVGGDVVTRIEARPLLTILAAAVPRGGALPARAWRARHRGIVVLLWAHVVGLAAIGVAVGEPIVTCVLAPGIVATLTAGAMWGRLSQTVRALMATLGLLSSSAILVHLFDGLIEAHFHFFLTVAVVSLYQSWRPYLLAVGFVLVHHLAFATLIPDHVYNHPMAVHHPWVFALVHGGAILAESVACLVFWRVSEEALDAERVNREALERANVELTRVNSAVADLASTLSHDLRTPLVVLVGRSEWTLETWPDLTEADRLEFVHKVNRAGRRLQAMIEDTLTVSALDGGGVEPRPAPVRVDAAVREVLAALPGPLPEVDLDDLEACTALVDSGHLSQVLTNLLTNAVKYGGSRIAVTTGTDARHVHVRVVDFGAGVPAAFVPRLFDRFSRSEEARGGTQTGTGLGLYISRNLLAANGGDLSYEATPGGGATFCLRLPLAASV
jgi:signal transduction histidine kinase